ncbi:MAG TPA: hypothetical protein VLT33_06270 [Labilithrix sp.]|nr:hypothetical protein [Labilithrix sp.]
MNRSFFALLVAAALATGACAPHTATTEPAIAPKNAQVLAAHGYAIPRDQLVKDIVGALNETGWKVESGDPDAGVFVAKKGGDLPLMAHPNFTLTVVVKPAGDRLRVDVTSTTEPPQLLKDDFGKNNVWAFYDALDRRAGDPAPTH